MTINRSAARSLAARLLRSGGKYVFGIVEPMRIDTPSTPWLTRLATWVFSRFSSSGIAVSKSPS
jgi:hypothetical protein